MCAGKDRAAFRGFGLLLRGFSGTKAASNPGLNREHVLQTQPEPIAMKILFRAAFYSLIAIILWQFAPPSRRDVNDPDVGRVERLFEDSKAVDAYAELEKLQSGRPPAAIAEKLKELKTRADERAENNEAKRGWMTWVAAILAIVSLEIALSVRKKKESAAENANKTAKEKLPKLDLGDWIIAFWAIIPPLWFFVEWRSLSYGQELEVFKYSQELARNIWVAFVVLLVAILKGKWPLASDE